MADVSTLIGTAGAALGAIKELMGIAKTVRELTDKADTLGPEAVLELRMRIVDLLTKAADAREAQLVLFDENTTLKDKISQLERRLASRSKFERDAKNYELRTLARHSTAYAPKDSSENSSKKSIYLCVTCFDNERKSILQLEKQDFYLDTIKCPRCEARVFADNDIKMEAMTGPVRRGCYDDWF